MKSTKHIDQLNNHAVNLEKQEITELFKQEQNRTEKLSFDAAGLFLDASKNLIDSQTLACLIDFAESSGVKTKIDELFMGLPLNVTEDRAALHVALRAEKGTSKWIPSNFIEQARSSKNQLRNMVEAIVTGERSSDNGAHFSEIVMIGVGGSNLGPKLVCDALREEKARQLNIHFLDHLDGGKFRDLTLALVPERTLFVVASKSFGTSETLRNYESARAWLKSHLAKDKSTDAHFIAITANPDKAIECGINVNNILEIPDWIGGRYSVWSAMGLPIALQYSYDVYAEFLAGAALMDAHFKTTPLGSNLPVILGMLSIWNTNFLNCHSTAIIPYEDRLRSLPMYLQQLEMESNGKHISLDGTQIEYHSAAVTWGAAGTDAQHSFCQLLHQGTHRIPVDFILSLKGSDGYEQHQDMLVANCLAQSQALMLGNKNQNVAEKYKNIHGNKPSSILFMDELNPKTLGALIALYEHKTFVQSVIWNINPFDQWGIELGKVLASSLTAQIQSDEKFSSANNDTSTSAILARYKKLKGNHPL